MAPFVSKCCLAANIIITTSRLLLVLITRYYLVVLMGLILESISSTRVFLNSNSSCRVSVDFNWILGIDRAEDSSERNSAVECL